MAEVAEASADNGGCGADEVNRRQQHLLRRLGGGRWLAAMCRGPACLHEEEETRGRRKRKGK